MREVVGGDPDGEPANPQEQREQRGDGQLHEEYYGVLPEE